MNSVIIFAKYPSPGKVKTRLGKQVGYEVSAALYRLFVEETFALVKRADVQNVYVAIDPEEKLHDFSTMVPRGFHVFSQSGKNLGERLFNAFDYVSSEGAERVMALGSDSPTLPAEFVDRGFSHLANVDLVVGPADDGGYYLIGVKQPEKRLFENIDWGSDSVLQTTIKRAAQLQMSYSLLPSWYDVDELQTLRRAVQDDSSGRIRSYVERECKSAVLC